MPYQKIGDAPANIRSLRPASNANPIPLTLSQINWIANVADGMAKGNPSIKSPWAVAIANFKKAFEVKDGRWVKKKKQVRKKSEIMQEETFFIFNNRYYVK